MKENDKRLVIKDSIVEYFDESHTYLIDGEPTLSATQVSQLLNPFKIMKIPSDVLKKAGDKGTKIHKAIETFLKTGEEFDKNDTHYGYFEAFLKFYADYGKDLEINSLEHIAIAKKDGLNLVGTIDFQGKLNGKNVIIDWKTSSMISVPEWRTQLSIYGELVKYTHGIDDVDRYILWLKKDGNYELLQVEPLEDSYFDLLLYILHNQQVIERFNILLYKIYGGELGR